MDPEMADASTHYDQDDIDDAIDAFADDDLLRFRARAGVAALQTDLSADDVLNEAIKLLLSGVRPWRRGVEFEAHITMVMKQVGSNRRRALGRIQVCELEVNGGEAIPSNDPSIEEAVASSLRVQQLAAAVSSIFDGDAEAWAIFEARLVEQLSIEDACEFAGIARERYETVLKRVTRALTKARTSGVLR